MMRRFFLSDFIVFLGRKAVTVQEPRVPSSGAAPDAAPHKRADDEPGREARALARLILRRAGIAPLVPAVAMLVCLAQADSAGAEPGLQSAGVRTAAATARATIVTASVELRAGQLQIGTSGSPQSRVVQPQRRLRACPIDTHGHGAVCAMIVYDLP